MFVKKSKIKKMTNRIEEFEELICPFNSHEFVILETNGAGMSFKYKVHQND